MRTATVWQVEIEGEGWRYTSPAIAAFVSAKDPGRIRLAEVQVPPTLRFYKKPRSERREITANRLRHAERALGRQREKVALFAQHLAVEQPTPLERVEHFDNAMDDFTRQSRVEEAARRRAARSLLRTLSVELQNHVLLKLDKWFGPRQGACAIYLIGLAKKGELA